MEKRKNIIICFSILVIAFCCVLIFGLSSKKRKNNTAESESTSTQYKVKETRQVAMDHFGESDRWDTSEFEGLTPAGSTPDGLKWQKIQDIYDQEYPKIVNAASHDEAMAEYDKMISDMNDAGLEDVEKVITQNYQDRMKLWNE